MRKTIAVIGEGITEKYYIESLKGLSPFTVLPKELNNKASSLRKLEEIIQYSINDAYDEVYCLIDMDGKKEGKTNTDYLKLKIKYHNTTQIIKKRGIKCKIIFIETERCTELWFLYHFTKSSITREFTSYKEVENELKKFRPHYEKTEKYFRSITSLHKEMTNQRTPHGALKQAISNSKNSVVSKDRDQRNYTYSEIHILIEALSISNI